MKNRRGKTKERIVKVESGTYVLYHLGDIEDPFIYGVLGFSRDRKTWS